MPVPGVMSGSLSRAEALNKLRQPASGGIEDVVAWFLSFTPDQQAMIQMEAMALSKVEEGYHDLILSDLVEGERGVSFDKSKKRMKASNLDLLIDDLASVMQSPREHKADVDAKIKDKCRQCIIDNAMYQCNTPTWAEKEDLILIHPHEKIDNQERSRRLTVVNNWFSNTRRRAGFYGIEHRLGVTGTTRSAELFACLVGVCKQLTPDQQSGFQEITQSDLDNQCSKDSLLKLEQCLQAAGHLQHLNYRTTHVRNADGRRDSWVTNKDLHGVVPTVLECVQKYVSAVRRAVWDDQKTVRPALEDAFLVALAHGRGSADQTLPVSTVDQERTVITEAIASFDRYFTAETSGMPDIGVQMF